MLLKQLEIMNCRKIRQAIIEFHGPGLQVIQGVNQCGKTTVAQCIAMTLDGPASFVPGMITNGEAQAEIIAYTDDGLKIQTQIKESVKQTAFKLDEATGKYLQVSSGVRTFLNSIRSGLEMPWSLRDMSDEEIINILKDRTGTTEAIAKIDLDTKDKESLRTMVGRDKKNLGAMEPVEPKEAPQPIDNIRQERQKAVDYLESVRGELNRVSDACRGKCNFQTVDDMREAVKFIEANAKRIETALAKNKAYTQADVDRLDAQINAWVEEDKKAIAYTQYKQWKRKIDKLTEQYETLTAEIEALRAERKKALSKMSLGIKGLEIGDDNFLYHKGVKRGVTKTSKIGNWSTAESVGVFFSIGACFSGKMKVLVVDNAESLDENTTGVISGWADKNGFLVILLKVAEAPEQLEEGVIYLKEGEVVTA
jgi:predicted ATP-dependent endonuclease of OLD family